MSRRAVFVDRDGVINALVPDPVSGVPESPLHPAQMRLLPGAAAALARLHDAGRLLIGVSNQPAAAKGTISRQELAAVQARMEELLTAEGVAFDDFRLCRHHPNGVVAELSGPCPCRKPAPGMLLDAARDHGLDLGASWMIGDTDADVGAGVAAGVQTVLIAHPDSAHKRLRPEDADHVVEDLAAAAQLIVRQDG